MNQTLKFDCMFLFEIQSYGVRFVTPQPHNAPYLLPWTGLKKGKFYGPDPGLTWLFSAQTGPKQFITNSKIIQFQTQHACEFSLKWNDNSIQCTNQG